MSKSGPWRANSPPKSIAGVSLVITKPLSRISLEDLYLLCRYPETRILIIETRHIRIATPDMGNMHTS
jgi:hypothetical protein